jgi:hypothetical protein
VNNQRSRQGTQGTLMTALLILAALSVFVALVAAVCAAAGAEEAPSGGARHRMPPGGATPILRIPARRSHRAGTFDRIEGHLRKRLSMYNERGKMNAIRARAGPCWNSCCGKLCQFFNGILRAGNRLWEVDGAIAQSVRITEVAARHIAAPPANAFFGVIRT